MMEMRRTSWHQFQLCSEEYATLQEPIGVGGVPVTVGTPEEVFQNLPDGVAGSTVDGRWWDVQRMKADAYVTFARAQHPQQTNFSADCGEWGGLPEGLPTMPFACGRWVMSLLRHPDGTPPAWEFAERLVVGCHGSTHLTLYSPEASPLLAPPGPRATGAQAPSTPLARQTIIVPKGFLVFVPVGWWLRLHCTEEALVLIASFARRDLHEHATKSLLSIEHCLAPYVCSHLRRCVEAHRAGLDDDFNAFWAAVQHVLPPDHTIEPRQWVKALDASISTLDQLQPLRREVLPEPAKELAALLLVPCSVSRSTEELARCAMDAQQWARLVYVLAAAITRCAQSPSSVEVAPTRWAQPDTGNPVADDQ